MKRLLAAALAALAVLAASPAAAQRLLAAYEVEQRLASMAHFPDADIRDAIAADPDLAYTYAQQPSEVWRIVLELRQRISPGISQMGQPVIVYPVPHPVVIHRRSRHGHDHHHRAAPRDPNGPPSPAVQLQQGHLPSPAVRMQQQRIPESQRQPIVQHRHPAGHAEQPRRWRGAP